MSNPNVLLLVLDSVRAANTSVNNSSVTTTPFLSSFANNATNYTQARAPSTWSLPSHVSIFTGEHAHSHGVISTTNRLRAGHSIFEELSKDGYSTGVFSDNPFLVETTHGLKNGFDHVESGRAVKFKDGLNPVQFVIDHGVGHYAEFLKACLKHDKPLKSIANGVNWKLEDVGPKIPLFPNTTLSKGTEFVEPFFGWVDSQTEPWAACVNLMDAHTPYEPTELVEGDETLVSLRERIDNYVWDFYAEQQPWWLLKAMEPLYNDSIRDADKAVNQLINELKQRGLFDETLIVITSDHGEGFGEQSEVSPTHRIVGHGRFAAEELLHVPLVVKYPEQTTGSVNRELSTLTAFPSVVRAVRNDAAASFATPNGAYASVSPGDLHMIPNRYQQLIDTKPFEVATKVVYEQHNDEIQKVMKRGSEAATWNVTEWGKWKVSADASDVDVKTRFKSVQTESLTDGEGQQEYNDATLNRLRELGYA
ncbi:sulfatase [Haladaptatus sp. CMSO5]|uniref:sulfatase n=1 Tax=Haladaptatus sp. CMSO5 TaxID=3120514 RepID=UPI002FCE105A